MQEQHLYSFLEFFPSNTLRNYREKSLAPRLFRLTLFFFFPFYFTQGQKGFVNYIPSELQVLELGKMLSRSIFLAYFKVASRNMYNFSEIFPLTLLFGHPYTFIRNQKKIPPTPLNGVIWSYTLIEFSDFVLLTLLFGLILYSELQSTQFPFHRIVVR